MSSDRKLDQDAVQTAREFLLGRTGPGGPPKRRSPAPRRNGPPWAPELPEPAPRAAAAETPPPSQAPWIELSAPDLRRTDSGWRARCIHSRGVDSRHVGDARYGGYVGSFIAALDVRDRFYRERGMTIPWEIEAVVGGERVAPEVVRKKRALVVRWQSEEHEVTGADAEEIATELALDLFVEFLGTLQARATEGSRATEG